MSKKRDPLSVVIQYFTTADLALAEHSLTVVREIIKSRQATAPGQKKPASAAKRKPDPATATEPALN